MSALARNWPGRWVNALLDFLYPPLCLLCRRSVGDGGHLCSVCWSNIDFLDGPVCSCCGAPFEIDPGADMLCAACQARPPAYDAARSVMRYEETSKRPILALKHGDRLDLAPTFAEWLARAGRELLEMSDIIVPVPLHRRRLWARRYNQAALLAKALARRVDKAYDPLILWRTRPTPSQGEMRSAKARRRNVMGAFRVARTKAATVGGRAVLLIDDVMTTGATVEACARTLKRSGAEQVFVLTLARVVRANAV